MQELSCSLCRMADATVWEHEGMVRSLELPHCMSALGHCKSIPGAPGGCGQLWAFPPAGGRLQDVMLTLQQPLISAHTRLLQEPAPQLQSCSSHSPLQAPICKGVEA